jgi:hypothetical protein
MFQQAREGRLLLGPGTVATIVCAAALLLAGASSAQALTVITGTVGGTGKYLLTGSPVNVSTNAVLKITFEITTPGENVELCAGSPEDFTAGRCSTRLSDSGGPGFTFLTIVDAASLNGKVIFVMRVVGVNPASFRFTIE